VQRTDRRIESLEREIWAFWPRLHQRNRCFQLFTVNPVSFSDDARKHQLNEDRFECFDVEQDFQAVFHGWSHERVQRRSLMDIAGADRHDRASLTKPDAGVDGTPAQPMSDELSRLAIGLAEGRRGDTHPGGQTQRDAPHRRWGATARGFDVQGKLDRRACARYVRIEGYVQLDGRRGVRGTRCTRATNQH
jgi:hypothetical protein